MTGTLVRIVIAQMLFACAPTIGHSEPVNRPNILLFLADDVGREVLGCYGGTSYETPRIDELAAGGMRFAHAYVMPSCHPTRVCLLTGQYPFRLGHPDWGTFPTDAEARTLPNLLKRAGYATAIAGKWQLAMLQDDLENPHRLGFDDYCLFGWHEGPRYYQPHIWQNGKLRDDVADRFGPDVYCEFLIDFMRRHRAKPFFAFYSMALCHDVTDDLDEPVPYGPRGRYDNYAEMVDAMDARVGRMIDALSELKLSHNTLIIYVTDNGTAARTIVSVRNGEFVQEANASEFGGEIIPGGKAQLTDWGTRVPTIVRWPGVVPAGSVSDALIDASDFLPTLAEVAGAELPFGIQLDGKSFASELYGQAAAPRDWVFAEHKGRAFVKNHRWKLYSDGRLFDLQRDPHERIETDTNGAVRATLQSAMNSLFAISQAEQ